MTKAMADLATRKAIAARPGLAAGILQHLAQDPAPEVRSVVAANPGATGDIDLALARDPDAEVRSALAEKVGRLAPDLGVEGRRAAVATIEILIGDQVARVRQVLAEALAQVDDAPRDLVWRLARDPSLDVCGPILELSRVLEDVDLLAIIASPPVQGAVAAVARRVDLGAEVADAIVGTQDPAAITDLLMNRSAQIREQTLDSLIEGAAELKAWHAPLVRRPQLSARAAERLARFVADQLLEELSRRADLPLEARHRVAQVVEQRLQPQRAATNRRHPSAERAEGLYAQGRLTEQELAQAIRANDRHFAIAALALLAGVDAGAVHRAIQLKSAKGAMALAWKAGLSPLMATHLQFHLVGIPPGQVIRPKLDTRYPLDEDEMSWQIEFLTA